MTICLSGPVWDPFYVPLIKLIKKVCSLTNVYFKRLLEWKRKNDILTQNIGQNSCLHLRLKVLTISINVKNILQSLRLKEEAYFVNNTLHKKDRHFENPHSNSDFFS